MRPCLILEAVARVGGVGRCLKGPIGAAGSGFGGERARGWRRHRLLRAGVQAEGIGIKDRGGTV